MATFGNTSSSSIGNLSDRLMACRFQMNSEDGTLQSISVYNNSGTGNINVGIYSDSGGNVGSLIASGTAASVTTGWITINVSASLSSDTYYWLAFAPSSAVKIGAAPGLTDQVSVSTSSGTTTLPSSWTELIGQDYELSIYATYEASVPDTTSLTSTEVDNELSGYDIEYDSPVQIDSETVDVTFSKSKHDHHHTSLFDCKEMIANNGSTILEIVSVTDFTMRFNRK